MISIETENPIHLLFFLQHSTDHERVLITFADLNVFLRKTNSMIYRKYDILGDLSCDLMAATIPLRNSKLIDFFLYLSTFSNDK